MAVKWSHAPILARRAATLRAHRLPPELPVWPGTCRPPDCAPSTGLDPRALRAWFQREPAPSREAAARSARLLAPGAVMTNRWPSRAPFFGILPRPTPDPLRTKIF